MSSTEVEYRALTHGIQTVKLVKILLDFKGAVASECILVQNDKITELSLLLKVRVSDTVRCAHKATS